MPIRPNVLHQGIASEDKNVKLAAYGEKSIISRNFKLTKFMEENRKSKLILPVEKRCENLLRLSSKASV
jgi:hypothetical protein